MAVTPRRAALASSHGPVVARRRWAESETECCSPPAAKAGTAVLRRPADPSALRLHLERFALPVHERQPVPVNHQCGPLPLSTQRLNADYRMALI